ncbi:DNA-binding transcriptional regulator, AcrR family [Actinokineospora alba]|uniref:DNA-binding transcriptional regulator, AcrR family n=1 Tax=Actinokineospora alba TaxID=504798 RepID=A0A1H0MWW2_9PSEU|nr:TetR family transcriptional regulator [Actinokineospora alba]TDP68466.1 TetR family transcriptional regulator [Actinokineospora alba]SDH79640.1 DNA-binding transcriptional regulator, AcrR family [Actinokineospora alba]SDO84852.1 DNA-binding transcriptional regulator, AcrR family [Actinokineospora alba]
MADEVQQTPKRGRRPGGTDTRAALLAAAREVFSEQGYDGATVRAIAARAGVDAAMVNHWFGGKDALFGEAVLQLPFNPKEIIAHLLEGGVDDLGSRIIRTFLTNWDVQGGGVFAALIRSVAAHEQVAHALRDFFLKNVFAQLAGTVADDRPELRANLVASQMIGLGVVRYVAKFDPLAESDVETLVRAIGPNVQRYLTGALD